MKKKALFWLTALEVPSMVSWPFCFGNKTMSCDAESPLVGELSTLDLGWELK